MKILRPLICTARHRWSASAGGQPRMQHHHPGQGGSGHDHCGGNRRSDPHLGRAPGPRSGPRSGPIPSSRVKSLSQRSQSCPARSRFHPLRTNTCKPGPCGIAVHRRGFVRSVGSMTRIQVRTVLNARRVNDRYACNDLTSKDGLYAVKVRNRVAPIRI